jgi:hypothetical protein
MSYTNTTFLGLKKADKGSNQPFETDVFNANWNAVDAGVSVLDGRLDVVEPKVTTLEGTAASNVARLNAVEANDWVVTARIADNQVTNAKLADNAVNTAELVDGAVLTAKLGDAQVTAGKLAATLDLTGKAVSVSAPTVDAHVATKKYVDDRIAPSSAWASYTPTFGGGVTGAGVYTQVGKTVFVRVRVDFSGTPSAAVTVTMPVVASTNVTSSFVLSGMAKGTYPLFGTISTGGGPTVTTVALKVMNTGSTYGTTTAISGSIPTTWADGDVVYFTAVYEAA